MNLMYPQNYPLMYLGSDRHILRGSEVLKGQSGILGYGPKDP